MIETGRERRQQTLYQSIRLLPIGMGRRVDPTAWHFTEDCAAWWRCYHDQQAGSMLSMAGINMALHPDQVLLLPPGLRYRLQVPAGIAHCFIHFHLQGLPPRGLRLGARVTCLDCDQDMRQALRGLHGLAAINDPSRDLQTWASVHAFLATVLARASASLDAQDAEHLSHWFSPADPIRRVLTMMEADPGQRLDNQTLAAQAGLQEDHFIRRFRQTTGESPQRLLRRLRLERAAADLHHGTDAIELIAGRWGFADRTHFSRLFRARYGCGPATWRRRERSA
ncbi:MAG: helix-turn-helix domain-containing protein [Planctomycetota bacterium]